MSNESSSHPDKRHADDETWARYWTYWYERHTKEAAEAKRFAEEHGAVFTPSHALQNNALGATVERRAAEPGQPEHRGSTSVASTTPQKPATSESAENILAALEEEGPQEGRIELDVKTVKVLCNAALASVPSATPRITDDMVDRALEAAKGAMVDTRRFWTNEDRAAVRAMLAAAHGKA